MFVPSQTLSFDVGKTSGWADFRDGELVAAWFGPFKKMVRPGPTTSSTLVLVETPHYAWRSSTEDLVKLGVMVGRVEEFYSMHGCDVEQVKPVTWKGSVDGEVMHQRIVSRLTAEELALLPRRPRAKDFDHNMVDAIGLGLWKLGRLR